MKFKDTEKVQRAYDIATKCHNNQFRWSKTKEGKKIPYIQHPLAVMEIAVKIAIAYLTRRKFFPTSDVHLEKTIDKFIEDIKIVSLLRDTVEDSEENYKNKYIQKKDMVSLKRLEKEFDVHISKWVEILTKNKEEEYDIAIGKASEFEETAIVKAADNIHNASSLNKDEPGQKNKRRVYLISRRHLLYTLGLKPEDLDL